MSLNPATLAPTGWFDDRFMEAYDLIWAIMDEHATAEDKLPELRSLLSDIERADQLLSDVFRGRVS